MTLRGYEKDIRQIFAFLDNNGHELKDLNYLTTQYLELSLKKRSMPAALKKPGKCLPLRVSFKFLKREGILSNNNWEIVSTPKKEKKLPKVSFMLMRGSELLERSPENERF